MRNILLVAWREFRERMRRRGFVITSLVTPLIFVAIWAFTGTVRTTPAPAANLPEQSVAPSELIGYVDQASLVLTIPAALPSHLFQAYPDVAAANDALQAGDISAYYVIPPDYRDTGSVQRVSQGIPTAPPAAGWFKLVLIGNLFPDASPQELSRLLQPLGAGELQFINVTPGVEGGGVVNTALPLVVTIAIMIPLFTSGGFLFQSLVQEKSSRVMEILLVSLRPRQLLAGKILGLGALTVVQYVIWMAVTAAALMALGRKIGEFLGGINMSLTEALLVVPYALGGFILYAGLMAGIGAMTPDAQGSRAWVFVITLPMVIPIYLWTAIVAVPDGALATTLSLIPFSAPLAMLMRMTSTVVPGWQLGVSLALLLLTAIGIVLLMAKLFRAQTLLSGEAFSLQRLWSALT